MPPKGPLRGALKNKGEKVYTTQAGSATIPLTPGTFFTSPATGIGKRGIDLQKCYEGQYAANGKRQGFGVYKYANGYLTYEGEYVNGQKHGNGRLTFKDGGYYEGRFENDEINGQGTRKFANGNTWVGSFVDGEMHGPGTLTFANGDRYEGNMVHNKMHGSAMFKFKNGNSYRGEFVDNKLTGQGVMTYRNGDRYKGDFVNGKRHGRGRCSYATGDHYTGRWEEDLYHGEGALVYVGTGIRYEGLFVHGKPSALPTKLNVFWHEAVGDGNAKGGKKPAAPAKGAGAGGNADEPPPLLQNTLGTPLAVPLTIAAQLPEPVPGPPEPDPTAPPPSGAAAPTPPPGAEPASGLQPAVTAKPPAGHTWRTSEMEYGRVVYLTLHHSAPHPTTPDRPVGLQLVTTLCADGTVALRALCTSQHLGPALPLRRHPDSPDEPLRCLELTLEKGQAVLDALTVGELADFAALQCNDGVGFLVAQCGWGLEPGACRVALPDAKAKNPNGEAGKGAAGKK